MSILGFFLSLYLAYSNTSRWPFCGSVEYDKMVPPIFHIQTQKIEDGSLVTASIMTSVAYVKKGCIVLVCEEETNYHVYHLVNATCIAKTEFDNDK